jgi:hypothetical protein
LALEQFVWSIQSIFLVEFNQEFIYHYQAFSLGLIPPIFVFYYLFFIYSFDGKTPGLYFTKLTIGHKEKIELSAKDCIHWSLSQLLCFLSLGTFYVVNLFTKDSRGLPQIISGLDLIKDSAFKAHKKQLKENQKVIPIHAAALNSSIPECPLIPTENNLLAFPSQDNQAQTEINPDQKKKAA